MSELIDRMFNDHTGYIAQAIPGYAKRTGQTILANAIEETLNTGGILLGEAPTGTGKTVAYLVPAIAHALKTNRSVLVVTANKALQEQLIEKDLPLLTEAFKSDDGTMFSYQLVKGRANYLCQRELALFDSGAPLPGLTADDIDLASALSAWGHGTITGDQSDAPAAVPQRVWNMMSVSGDRCSRSACVFQETCFADKPLRDAETATVVVANYDLFFSKLMFPGTDQFWFRFGAVIFDEAHDASEFARNNFGNEMGFNNFNQLASDITQFVGGDRRLARQVRDVAHAFFDGLARYSLNSDTPRVEEKHFISTQAICDVLDDVRQQAGTACPECGGTIGCGTCAMRKRVHERAKLYSAFVEEFAAQGKASTAYWIEKPGDSSRITGTTVKMRSVPYDVGELLSKYVFSRYRSVICVSATLTSGGTFDFIRKELGLVLRAPKQIEANDREDADDEEVVEYAPPPVPEKTWKFALYSTPRPYGVNVTGLRVASPFDFAKQAKLIIPLHIPFPIPENGYSFIAAATDAIRKLIQDCRGRTLVLFTSWARLKYAAERLEVTIDYPLLVQGDAPNKALAQMFRNEPSSVLLATKSFWMGLDVQGESLSCLVIDKLPLESLGDPIIDMMKQQLGEKFWDDFYFPRAAIKLSQGAGRLIRAVDDRGVLVCLDQRLNVAKYGAMMRRSLPFVGFSKNLADAGKFLDAGVP